jgi:eukaryotic-like serine/threonine-protein kinase
MPEVRGEKSSPALDPARARVGTLLNEKWQLDAVIGVGGMAAVYEATHRNGKRAAIKVLHAELSADAEIRARFLREGYVANRVEHPGAVSVLDDDVTADGAFFLVMELLAGETLDDRVRRVGPQLDALYVLSVVEQVLDVLSAAHAKGIVHRDIKPENIFLTEAGAVKVLDFGIARLRELAGPGAEMARVGTQSGLAMGTPGFMPPEQARGRWDEVDARSDLWAVGATLFSMIAGRPVHQAQTVNELLLAAMTQPAAPLATVFPGATVALSALVDRALAYRKEERFADAAAMQAQLREARRSLGLAGAPDPSAAVRAQIAQIASPTAITTAGPALLYPAGPLSGAAPAASPWSPEVGSDGAMTAPASGAASSPDAPAVADAGAGREALASATTVPASQLPRSADGSLEGASSGAASRAPRSGGARVLGALMFAGLALGTGGLFAYPDAPVTLRVRSVLSPLLIRGARAIAPEASSQPAGGDLPPPDSTAAAEPEQPAPSAAPPAASARLADAVLPPGSASSGAEAPAESAAASAAPVASAAPAAPTGSSAAAHADAGARHHGARPSKAVVHKVEPPHAKPKPKWQPPPSTKKKTKGH